MSQIAGQKDTAGDGAPATKDVDVQKTGSGEPSLTEQAGMPQPSNPSVTTKHATPREVGFVLVDREANHTLIKALRIAQKKLDITERESARSGQLLRSRSRTRRSIDGLVKAINRKCADLHDTDRNATDYFRALDRIHYEARACSGGLETDLANYRHHCQDPNDHVKNGDWRDQILTILRAIEPSDQILVWTRRRRLLQLIRARLDDDGVPVFLHNEMMVEGSDGHVSLYGRIIRLRRSIIEQGNNLEPSGETRLIADDINRKCWSLQQDRDAGRILSDRYEEMIGLAEREAWLRTDGIFHTLWGLEDPLRPFLETLSPGENALLWLELGTSRRYVLGGRDRQGDLWIGNHGNGLDTIPEGVIVFSAIDRLRLNLPS